MALARDLALSAYHAAVAAGDGRALVRRALAGIMRPAAVTLLAAGKAAAAMAAGAEGEWGPLPGLVVAKDGHGLPLGGPETLFASHPRPDARSASAGAALLERAARARGELLVLWSGGASALAVAPAEGLTLEEKATAVAVIVAAGAPITAINAVRKHLSRLKGGQLAASSSASSIRALVLSDVLGDDASVVGGGPVSADPTTFGDALDVVGSLPVSAAVRARLVRGERGEIGETPKPGDPRLARVTLDVLAGPDLLVAAAAAALRAAGAIVVTTLPRVACPVEELAARLVAEAGRLAGARGPVAFVAGGEPTVRLPSVPGRGGRAQHAALLAALALRPTPGVSVAILAAGSDGTDGPTADAGGVVDPGTAERARRGGVDPDAAAAAFDAGRALAAAGDLVTPGPTGTNLCDLFLVVATPG